MKATVVGAGIGGLTAALALRNAGIDVEIHEQTSELREVGAGISLWANAIRALAKLGLGEALQARSVAYSRTAILRADGQVIAESLLDELVRSLGAGEIPALLVLHRADLLGMLSGRLDCAIRLGQTCTGFEMLEDRVIARFAGGVEVESDLLIGADGIHSGIRAQLRPGERVHYSGYTAWRAVSKFEAAGWGVTETWGRGRRFGVVPMAGGLVYWFATQNAPQGQTDPPGAAKQNLLELFQGWHDPIHALISATQGSAILRNDIQDRDPLANWGTGRVTLLGDAAHPMTPNFGQGGCQAIEDALVLARMLRTHSEVPAALRSYEAERIARTTPIVLRSRQAGVLAQLENPLACRIRDFTVGKIPRAVMLRQLQSMVGYTGHLN
ncbi:MAG TPA: FAD-dependent monooxygenase [Bryobacteraceae bacterium]|nr:FAD-dependent monooxygenase [Bryobacteraceae bacterium]